MPAKNDANSKRKPRAKPAAPKAESSEPAPPKRVLVIDIGGTKVKVLATGETEPRKAPSGRGMTPAQLVEAVRELTKDWKYEGVSIGYPGLVGNQGPRSEARNLGPGWVGFNYGAAFDLPVRIINDAAMQALGSYEGGRMLFLGLGTGLGSTLIAENVIVPLELGDLQFEGRTLGETLGRRGLEKIGKKAWREIVSRVVPMLMSAFVADYVVLGGGNAKELKGLPPGTRLGHNLTAFRGGSRLWHLEDVPTLSAESHDPAPSPDAEPIDWRMI